MKRTTTLFCAILAMVAVSAQPKGLFDLSQLSTTPNHTARVSGNLADSSMTYHWTGTVWDSLAKKVFSYDAMGRISVLKEYDPVTGELEHQSDFTYHTNGEISLILVKANAGGTMEPFERYRYNFDAKNNRTSYNKDKFFLQTWVQETGDSILYEYGPNDRVLSYTLFQINSGAVYYYQKLIWSDFNTLDLPQTLTVQVYQGGFENYIQMKEISWRAGFNLTNFSPSSYFGYTWFNGAWKASVYDSSIVTAGRIDKSYLFYWDGNTLDTAGRTEYTYDVMGHRMQSMTFIYNGGWAINGGDRDSIEYGSYDEIKKQTKSFYSNSNQTWEYLNEERFYYNGLSVGELKNQTVTLYPNPARSRVTLAVDSEIQAVQLVDLQGKVYPVSADDKQIDLSGIPGGLYLIRVMSEGKVRTGKLEILP